MSDIRKEQDTGAIADAVTGAEIGPVAVPAGTVVGSVVGGTPADGGRAYEQHFEARFRDAPYYARGSDWSDYQPAYQFGYDTYAMYRGQRFDDVEAQLQRDWERVRGPSRLAWADARDAVRDCWHHIERAQPGDFDREPR